MGGFNFSTLGAGTARTNAPTIAQIEDGSLLLIGSVAGTNTITGSLTPAITAYAAGQLFSFVPANNNTGATTININSVGAASIKQAGSFALAGDELVAGTAAYIFYDGTNFELLNPQRIYVGVGENDTSERTFSTVSSGSAAGNTYTRRILGSGSNAVATLRDYIGSTKILEATTSLYSIVQAALFGAQADFTDISTPAAPGAGLTRLYTKSGGLYIFPHGGAETAISQSALASALGLIVKNNAVTPNTKIDITVTQAILTTSAGTPIFYSGGTNTVDCGTTGANGLDTGSLTTSTWYYVYLIYNPSTATFASLASLSSSAPTLPSGYTYTMRVGAMITDGSSHFMRSVQLGNQAEYDLVTATNTLTYPAISGTGNQSVSGVVPATARSIRLNLAMDAQFAQVSVMSNNSVGGGNSTYAGYSQSGNVSTFNLTVTQADILLIRTTINIVSQGQGVYCRGWTDAVNAN